MARIRSIHPNLFTGDSFMEATANPAACLFLIGLWVQADDKGAFEWKPSTLKARIMPATAEDGAKLLDFLASLNLIAMYQVDGVKYGAIRKFGLFQRPKKPNDLYPMPKEWRIYAATDKPSTEPEDGEGGGGTEPDTPSDAQNSPPVPPQYGTGTENQKQMKEEGGSKEERTYPSDTTPADAVASPEPIDARTELWRDGLAILHRLTGKPDGPCRAFLGKMLKAVADDCPAALAILREAERLRPADPAAWITAAAKARAAPAPTISPRKEKILRAAGLWDENHAPTIDGTFITDPGRLLQ